MWWTCGSRSQPRCARPTWARVSSTRWRHLSLWSPACWLGIVSYGATLATSKLRESRSRRLPARGQLHVDRASLASAGAQCRDVVDKTTKMRRADLPRPGGLFVGHSPPLRAAAPQVRTASQWRTGYVAKSRGHLGGFRCLWGCTRV